MALSPAVRVQDRYIRLATIAMMCALMRTEIGAVMNAGEDDLPDIVDLVMEIGRAEDAGRKVPSPPLPAGTIPRLPLHLEALADRARGLCRSGELGQHAPRLRRRLEAITALASGGAAGATSGDKKSVATIERRLSALSWNFAQRGQPLDRKDRHVATVMAGIRNRHAAPPRQKEAVLPEDLIAMLETLDRGTLRGLRDRAMLLLGLAGGLRRSEIVGLDVGRDQTEDGRGWVDILDKGILVILRGKTGWREVEVGRGSSDTTCPVVALKTWLKLGADRPRPPLPPSDGARQESRRRAAQRPGGRAPCQTHCAGSRCSRRSAGGNAASCSPDTPCGPALPLRPRSTSALFRSSSATRALR
jgi:integrase